MRVLYVWSSAEWSTYDVARGLNRALKAQGHEVEDYRLYRRFAYHQKALIDRPELAENTPLIARLATECVVVEALNMDAELIIFASALAAHPNGVVLARRAGFPVAVLHTESPYEDEHQAQFSSYVTPGMTFTHERASARRLGWHYLPHAYDPAIHHPVTAGSSQKSISGLTHGGKAPTCDVLILGTGWPERVKLLSAVDWTGIDLRILGLWPEITPDHPLAPYYTEVLVGNEVVPWLYASAKICLNFHRANPYAVSLNPRAYEIAACGAFQISDPRPELAEIFGDCVPTFTDPASLQALVRHYLGDAPKRSTMALCATRAVQGHTFKVRAAEMMDILQAALADRAVTPSGGF